MKAVCRRSVTMHSMGREQSFMELPRLSWLLFTRKFAFSDVRTRDRRDHSKVMPTQTESMGARRVHSLRGIR